MNRERGETKAAQERVRSRSRANETIPTPSKEISMSTVSNPQFDGLSCVECSADRAVPGARAVPTGERDGRGAQLFKCAPGTGCQDNTTTPEQEAQTYTERIIARIMRAMDPADMSLVDLSTETGIGVHELAATFAGKRPLYLNEAFLLGHAVGIGLAVFGEGVE